MQDFYSFYSLPPLLKPPVTRIYPLFIPFAGCEKRCAFCAQELQTGQSDDQLEFAESALKQRLTDSDVHMGQMEEVAFFGGTFTLLPEEWQRRFLTLGQQGIAAKRISGLRCSTRPDAVDHNRLARLNNYGLKTVELGVQSFDDHTLEASGRGYTGKMALDACERVIKNRFNLIVQLMPGMPGQAPEAFRRDIEKILILKPAAVRLYPCVVIEGTNLAEAWRKGKYQPWELAQTIKELAAALLNLNLAKIPVIRLGLSPEKSLLQNLLAGPWHPALGSRAQAAAMYFWLNSKLKNLPHPRQINLPSWMQGFFWGNGKELEQAYRNIGIYNDIVIFWRWPVVKITAA